MPYAALENFVFRNLSPADHFKQTGKVVLAAQQTEGLQKIVGNPASRQLFFIHKWFFRHIPLLILQQNRDFLFCLIQLLGAEL